MKKLIMGMVASVVLALGLLPAATAFAAVDPAHVGSFQVGDRGHGGWAGGDLLADGHMHGGGEIAFKTPDGVLQHARILVQDPGSTWQYTDASHSMVNFCFVYEGQAGYIFPPHQHVTDCSITIPVNAGKVQVGGAGDPDLWGDVIVK